MRGDCQYGVRAVCFAVRTSAHDRIESRTSCCRHVTFSADSVIRCYISCRRSVSFHIQPVVAVIVVLLRLLLIAGNTHRVPDKRGSVRQGVQGVHQRRCAWNRYDEQWPQLMPFSPCTPPCFCSRSMSVCVWLMCCLRQDQVCPPLLHQDGADLDSSPGRQVPLRSYSGETLSPHVPRRPASRAGV